MRVIRLERLKKSVSRATAPIKFEPPMSAVNSCDGVIALEANSCLRENPILPVQPQPIRWHEAAHLFSIWELREET